MLYTEWTEIIEINRKSVFTTPFFQCITIIQTQNPKYTCYRQFNKTRPVTNVLKYQANFSTLAQPKQ